MKKYYQNYIDGEWADSSNGEKRSIVNPATGKECATVAEGTLKDAKRAIAAAKRSFYETREWRDMCAPDRAEIMFRIARIIEERSPEFALLELANCGKPLREAEGDVGDTAACFKYYAGLIDKPCGGVQEVGDGFGKMLSMTVHEPVGVCGAITPWNFPLLTCGWKLAPALAAGNSVVFNPSGLTPLTSALLFEVFEQAGLPKGAANLVMGRGSVVGAELAESRDVDMITFTGSTEVGQGVMRAAASNIKKTCLELGGKSPNVIFADADFEGAVEWAMFGGFFHAGQNCNAGSRLVVEESIKDRFLARLAERANALVFGDPLKNPDMSAMISENHMNSVLGYIETGKKEGARCICGGERYLEGDCANGFFIRPTVFADCTPDMTIVKEEIFGPVMTVQTFKTEEEVIEIANDTIYGLAGGVFTSDGSRALRVIKELRAGTAWINCYNPAFPQAPFGGYKMSGTGRDIGEHSLHEFQEIKHICIKLDPGIIGWYPN